MKSINGKKQKNKIIMFQSPGIKSGQYTLPSTPQYSDHKKYLQYPQLFNLTKYENLFQQIYKNNERFANYAKDEEQEVKRNIIKKSIVEKLQRDRRGKGFESRFRNKKRNGKIILLDGNLGETQLQKQQKNRKIFFSNSSKVVILQQQCRLLQLFLQDLQDEDKKKLNFEDLKNFSQSSQHRKISVSTESQKSHMKHSQKYYNHKLNTQHLKNFSKTSQHRRISVSTDESQKSHLKHSQKYYNHQKTMNYVLNDKLFQSALQSARKNISYRRQQAYQSSLYVINQGFKNLLMSKQIIQNQKKQTQFNQLIKLFIYFAHSSQAQKKYYQQINKDKFALITESLTSIHPKITSLEVQNVIKNIVKLKYAEVLHFEDFKELIDTLNETFKVNIIQQLYKKKSHIFKNKYEVEREKLANIIEQKKQMTRSLHRQKLNIAFKLMFDNQQSKLACNKFLSIRYIVEMLKKYSIVPGIIWNEVVVMSCMWVQKRREGLDFQQFLDAISYMALSFQKWENFVKALKELNLGKLLLS